MSRTFSALAAAALVPAVLFASLPAAYASNNGCIHDPVAGTFCGGTGGHVDPSQLPRSAKK